MNIDSSDSDVIVQPWKWGLTIDGDNDDSDSDSDGSKSQESKMVKYSDSEAVMVTKQGCSDSSVGSDGESN